MQLNSLGNFKGTVTKDYSGGFWWPSHKLFYSLAFFVVEIPWKKSKNDPLKISCDITFNLQFPLHEDNFRMEQE